MVGDVRSLRHLPALDGLRGLAVLAVVLVHCSVWLGGSWADRVASGGALGVDLFFVLSGFLITTLLLEERIRTGRLDLKAFYVRRALRLLPALVAFLVVFSAYALAAGLGVGATVRTVGAAASYGFNWARVAGVPVLDDLNHTWSLAIEEQFYVMWPVAVLLATRWRPRAAIALLVGAIAASGLVRGWLYAAGDGVAAYYRTDARAEALLVGALLAVALLRGAGSAARWRVAGGLGAAVLAAFVLLPPSAFGEETGRNDVLFNGGLSVVALSSAAMVGAVAAGGWTAGPLLAWSPLRGLGRVSYGLYLWHPPVLYAVRRHGDGLGRPLGLVVAVVLFSAATWWSYRFVESPFLARKRRWERRRPPGEEPVEAGGRGRPPQPSRRAQS